MTNITKGTKDVNGKRTDNTIAKRKNYERQTMVHKTLDRKLSSRNMKPTKTSSNNKTLNARLLARVITGCHYM
jgi:5-keto 4-deoxyuronate isomerase